MTTIAYRDGIVAADSRGTLNGWVQPGRETKLQRMADGRVAGITGDSAACAKILAWIQTERETPQPEGDARVILFGAAEHIEVFEAGGNYVEDIHAPFLAWGSGMPVALGALHAGASAAEAVRIAGLVDTLTDTDVQTMKCEG